MAEAQPPSPKHRDESFLLRRLRIKSAMTVKRMVYCSFFHGSQFFPV